MKSVNKLLELFLDYFLWRNLIFNNRNALIDGIPWITFSSFRFLDKIIRKNGKSFTVFEYGSGGSTIYFSKRVKRVISVEHDKVWYEKVAHVLKENKIENCDLILIEPDFIPGLNAEPDDPLGYVSADERYNGYSFYRYASYIDSFPNKFFDLVMIDGRARPSCIFHAREKVKIGGYLLLDNSDRDYYQKGKSLLEGWKKYSFYGPGPYVLRFWETTIWIRL